MSSHDTIVKCSHCQDRPTFWQCLGSGLPLDGYLARRTRPADLDQVKALVRAHKVLTAGARDALAHRVATPNYGIRWDERYRHEFHSIVQSIKEIERSFPAEVVNSPRDAGCVCHDKRVQDVARYITIQSMRNEMEIHGRYPACRDASKRANSSKAMRSI